MEEIWTGTQSNVSSFHYVALNSSQKHIMTVCLNSSEKVTLNLLCFQSKSIHFAFQQKNFTKWDINKHCDIKFTKGTVLVNGYRLKTKSGKFSLRGWRIVGKTIDNDEFAVADFEGVPADHLYISSQDDIKSSDYIKELRIYRTFPNSDG